MNYAELLKELKRYDSDSYIRNRLKKFARKVIEKAEEKIRKLKSKVLSISPSPS